MDAQREMTPDEYREWVEAQPTPPMSSAQHMTAPAAQFEQQVLSPPKDVRKARDKAQYVRQQKGHSLTLHLLFGALVLWIPAIYYSFSPNHYWHV